MMVSMELFLVLPVQVIRWMVSVARLRLDEKGEVLVSWVTVALELCGTSGPGVYRLGCDSLVLVSFFAEPPLSMIWPV
jgi:hypothetical protein